jgi:hypothetical protein
MIKFFPFIKQTVMHFAKNNLRSNLLLFLSPSGRDSEGLFWGEIEWV